MKKIILILLSIAFLFGCSKKNNPSPQATITGKWNVTADTSRQYTSGVVASTYVIVGINSPYYQFNKDGTGTSKYNMGEPDIVSNFTYTLSDSSITIHYPNPSGDPNYINQSTYKIKKLTATKMILFWDDMNPANAGSGYQEYMYLSR